MSKAAAMAAALEKAIGKNSEHVGVTTWISTGFPPLDHAISGSYRQGGMPGGRIVEMFGPESSGKTAIASKVMASAQEAGGFSGFNDHERSFIVEQGASLGLKDDPSLFAFKMPKTFEESINIAVNAAETIRRGEYIDPKAPIAWVFDSLASMIPASSYGKEAGTLGMHDTTALARATSTAFRALNQYCEDLNMLALFLNQMRVKPGVTYGDPTTTPGGNAPKFYASVRIQLGRSMIAKGEGEAKELIGQEIKAKCIKNKVYRPFMTASWRFLFMPDGSGKFDVIGSTIDYLAKRKLLDVSGARITWDGKSYYRSQLTEKIEKEGLQEELFKLLPPDGSEEPEVPEEAVAEMAIEGEGAGDFS